MKNPYQESVDKLAVNALDHVPYGVVLVTEEMKVILHNETAAHVFSDKDGIELRQGHLELINWGTKEFSSQIEEQLNSVKNDEPVCTIILRVERPSGKLTYQMTLCPLNQYSDDAIHQHHGVWIVIIHDPEKLFELPRNLLRDYYRFTDAEIEVCHLLFMKGRRYEVSNALGVSQNTVKSHLMHIYQKCGVTTQSMLFMRLTLSLTAS